MTKTSALMSPTEEQWKHIKYRHLTLLTKDFIVFVDDDLDVDWETTEAYDERGHKDKAHHHDILNIVAGLEANPCSELSESIRLQYKRLIAEGLARSFEHDYVNARAILVRSANYIQARSQETSRFWYLTASVAMAALFLLIGFLIVTYRKVMIALVGEEGTWLCIAVAAGAAGALLSVIVRSGKLKFDCSAGRRLHYLEGISRIWAGGLSGFLVALAIQSGFVLSPLSQGQYGKSLLLLGAFVAGSGERLATSIISKIERTQVTENSAHTGAKNQQESTSDD